MNRQLYQAGSGIGSLDIPMDERILISETLEPESRDYINDELMSAEDKEVMERLMELQKNPEYQYNEENMYEGPRDMRMGGGVMSLRQPYFLGGVADFVGDIVSGAGDVLGGVVDAGKSLVKNIDLEDAAAVAAMMMGVPPQFVGPVYGAAGGDNPLIQGYTAFSGAQQPGGGFGFPGGGQSGGGFNFASLMPQQGQGGPKEFGLSDALRIGSSLMKSRQDRGGNNNQGNSIGKIEIPEYGLSLDIGEILKTLNIGGKEVAGAGAGAAYAKLAYEDQKRVMEEIRKRIAEQREDVAAYRQKLKDVAGTGRATGAPTTATDVVRSPVTAAQGGIINTRRGYMMGSEVPMRKNPAGIQELDYRQSGGFVPPIGIKEKADDIPAMLSNNEFVFTADAVRAAGGGSVNKGAQKMYALMKQLEGQA